MGAEVTSDKITLLMTCEACPEQYQAVCGSRQVGYLRLRWGIFRLDVPDCGGETIYEAEVGGEFQGQFTPEQREKYLEIARQKIAEWMNAGGVTKRSIPGRNP